MLKGRSGLIWLVLSIILLALDQITKWIVSTEMSLYQTIDILPVFNFTYVHNYGAAFSFLSEAGGWQKYFFSIIAVTISVLLIYWLKKLPATNKLLCSAYALVLAGAIGNLIDRLVHGYVIDFLHVYYQQYDFPVFNIADVAISIGAALLLLDAFFEQKESDK
ncbi:signal peptidase II [Pseudoalteromonas spongiae]|uniref:signal peptidase II n=1 Tax=Pseudoalteromonas spongiae TaxID=298657 RepID=UPI00026C9556|nr:signal peptidase II [Pseudoalteromonas spongiae]ATC98125.1 signal peptidase II [Pseudoalteromonas spongiae UST010723-006]